jgi:hypothetical protein
MVDIAVLRAKALVYRALAETAGDPVIHRELLFLAEQCEQMLAEAERPVRPRAAPAALGA